MSESTPQEQLAGSQARLNKMASKYVQDIVLDVRDQMTGRPFMEVHTEIARRLKEVGQGPGAVYDHLGVRAIVVAKEIEDGTLDM